MNSNCIWKSNRSNADAALTPIANSKNMTVCVAECTQGRRQNHHAAGELELCHCTLGALHSLCYELYHSSPTAQCPCRVQCWCTCAYRRMHRNSPERHGQESTRVQAAQSKPQQKGQWWETNVQPTSQDVGTWCLNHTVNTQYDFCLNQMPATESQSGMPEGTDQPFHKCHGASSSTGGGKRRSPCFIVSHYLVTNRNLSTHITIIIISSKLINKMDKTFKESISTTGHQPTSIKKKKSRGYNRLWNKVAKAALDVLHHFMNNKKLPDPNKCSSKSNWECKKQPPSSSNSASPILHQGTSGHGRDLQLPPAHGKCKKPESSSQDIEEDPEDIACDGDDVWVPPSVEKKWTDKRDELDLVVLESHRETMKVSDINENTVRVDVNSSKEYNAKGQVCHCG